MKKPFLIVLIILGLLLKFSSYAKDKRSLLLYAPISLKNALDEVTKKYEIQDDYYNVKTVFDRRVVAGVGPGQGDLDLADLVVAVALEDEGLTDDRGQLLQLERPREQGLEALVLEELLPLAARLPADSPQPPATAPYPKKRLWGKLILYSESEDLFSEYKKLNRPVRPKNLEIKPTTKDAQKK